jgi:hypothetical protein
MKNEKVRLPTSAAACFLNWRPGLGHSRGTDPPLAWQNSPNSMLFKPAEKHHNRSILAAGVAKWQTHRT